MLQVMDFADSGAITCTGALLRMPKVNTRFVIFQAAAGNAGNITIGGPGIGSGTGGFVLTPGQEMQGLWITDLSKFYVYGANNDLLNYLSLK